MLSLNLTPPGETLQNRTAHAIMVLGEKDLRGCTLMSEFLTPVHPQINLSILHNRCHNMEECQQQFHAGGMGDAATQFYKRLANLLSVEHGLSYGVVMGWN